MKKCKRCGRKGFFLKLKDGLCENCQRLQEFESQRDALTQQISSAQAELLRVTEKLTDQNALFHSIYLKAMDSVEQERKFILEQARKDAAEISEKTKQDLEKELLDKRSEVLQLGTRLVEQRQELKSLDSAAATAEKRIETAKRKTARLNETIKRLQAAIQAIEDYDQIPKDLKETISEAESSIAPTVEIKLHCMDVKELRKKYNQNKKVVAEVLEKYKGRYTTKTNAALYQLMTIALEAELQNILYNINFGKLEDAQNSVKAMCSRYFKIAQDGNQSIAPTLMKFIGEVQVLYLNAVNIEYEYYIKREQIREEQRAIREQMREEAADRRRLAEEQKKIEQQQKKYTNQIDMLQSQMEQMQGDDDKTAVLQKRIEELQSMLDSVENKKEEILSRQNGQAGHVYVISNLGSFGDDVFKVGMTRRLDPMERIDELGSASVPFPFDIHSVIFSENAVQLEHDLHVALNSRRLNKVNLRKEFFKIPLDDLESIVYQHDPSAEFNRTMLAEQYKQSLSLTAPIASPDAEVLAEESEDDE